ncbi:unnamed protein product [Dracunculus medinensis]|uniref:CAZy families GT2 protein n=1 Tax=Dracunculus medinensis TaxID=318479 RepID=A0A0N4UFQ4_DRAME|nr:unnamed protein product [Dracunculus medinensis]
MSGLRPFLYNIQLYGRLDNGHRLSALTRSVQSRADPEYADDAILFVDSYNEMMLNNVSNAARENWT